MPVADELKVILRAETAKAVRDMKKAQQQTNNTEQGYKKLVGTLGKSVAGWAAAAVSIRAVSRTLKESVRLARQQEEAEQSLTAALISTGREGEISATAIKSLASELQGITTFGDEATISAAALTQTLADLNQDQLTEIIPLIQDFASAMGMDLDQAAQLVGKSIGSSTNALTRYGVEIDNSLEGSQRFAAISTQLNEQFGGFARTVAQTASGDLTQLSNALGDMQEIGGRMILQFLQPATDWLTRYVTRINDTIVAKRTLNELEGQTTVSALEQRIAAQGTLVDNAEREFNIRQQQTREAEANLEREREMGIATVQQIRNLEDAVELRQEEQRIAFHRAAELRGEQNELKRQLALIKERNRLEAPGTAPLSNLPPLTDGAGQAGEDAGEAAAEGFYRSMDDASRDARSRMAPLLPIDVVRDSKDAADEMENNWKGAFTAISGSAMQTWSMINAAEAQRAANEKRRIDEQVKALSDRHERELAWAEAAGATDEELAQMKAEQLEAEQEAERQADKEKAKIAKKQFEREKGLKIAQTIQATALAVMQALAQLGPIAGAIAAGSISALGAKQLQLIASQEPPAFEKGGSFITDGPQTIQVGDGQSPRERVTVEPLTGPYARGGGGNTVHVHVNGVIDEEIAVKIKRAIERAEMRGAA